MLPSFKFTLPGENPLIDSGQKLQEFSHLSPPLQQHERSPQQLSFFTSLVEPAATVSIPPCASCGATQGRQTASKGPHYAGLRCNNCGRFIKWLPRPKTEFSSDGGQH